MILRRTLLAMLALTLARPALAQTAPSAPQTRRFGDPGAPEKLTIWGATDHENMSALIQAFLQNNPNIEISYRSMPTGDLDKDIRSGDRGTPDVAISSAADLQVKLVNDGYAKTYKPPVGTSLPDWANWRNQAFGFTTEPAVIVYSKQLPDLGPLPQTRLELAAMISKNQELFAGKIATYDVERSGIGYLLATKDSLYSSTYTTLIQSFGLAKARLLRTSAEMLDLLAKGDILIGYNVIGSYALQRLKQGAPIEIVLPQDYTLVLARVAILPVGSKRIDLGAVFLDFLLSPAARELQASLSDYENLPSQDHVTVATHPIDLGPQLLVFLDKVKQERFTSAWRKLIGKDE